MTIESLEQVFSGSHVGLVGPLSDYNTATPGDNNYHTVKELTTTSFKTMTFSSHATADIMVRVWGDVGDGSFDKVGVPAFLVTTFNPALPVYTVRAVGGQPYTSIRVEARASVAGVNGILSTGVTLKN